MSEVPMGDPPKYTEAYPPQPPSYPGPPQQPGYPAPPTDYGFYPPPPMAAQPGGYPPQPMVSQPGGYPPQPMAGQPGGYLPQPMAGQPGGYPPQPMAGKPGGYPMPPPAAQQGPYPGQPGMGYAPPPPGHTTVVVNHQPRVGVVRGPIRYMSMPASIVCQHCQATVVTATEYNSGILTWLICGALALVGCWLGCCLIPFCIDGTKDVTHKCPNCKNIVGSFRHI